jgi:signal transduction histidine kinase
MKDMSLLKFSRYFSLLYLGVTVLPLCFSFWWTSNHNHQLDLARRGQISEMLAQAVGLQLASNLKRENEQLDHIGLLLHQDPKLALKDFPQLFGVDAAWWGNPAAANGGAPSPALEDCAKILATENGIEGDYCLVGSTLETIQHLRVGHKMLYLSRSLPLEMIVPPGPHQSELFRGISLASSQRLAVYAPEPLSHRRHHPRRPHEFGSHDFFPANGHGPHHQDFEHGGPRDARLERAFHEEDFRHKFVGTHGSQRIHDDRVLEEGFFHDGPPSGMEEHRNHHYSSHFDEMEGNHLPPGFRPGDPPPFFEGGAPHAGEPMLAMGPDGRFILPPLQPERKQVLIMSHSGQPIASIVLRLRQRLAPIDPWNAWLGSFLLLSGLVLSAIAGWYIKQNFIRPLARLSLLSQDVRRGDLSGRVSTEGLRQREVLQTLTQFNAMLDELDEKEKLRHNFISNLTHDFRTPLIAQTRAIELLLEPDSNNDSLAMAGLLKSLLTNNEHLLGMVNQLLETYQFESGKITIQKESVDLPSLVTQCFSQLISLANSRQIKLEQNFPLRFPSLLADKAYLNRVFINLIGNAIENIPKGSQIVVTGELINESVADTEKWMLLRVRDNGPGLSAAAVKHLFDRYGAGVEEVETRKLGSGLGLYICKMFVEAHGGEINAYSTSGEGTEFTIRLPWQDEIST